MGLNPASNMRVPLKYICEDIDRHGNVRCYVRAPGKRKVRLRALPGTPEFMEGISGSHRDGGRDAAAAGRRGEKGIISLSLHPLLCERGLQGFGHQHAQLAAPGA